MSARNFIAIVIVGVAALLAPRAQALDYGDGTYGSCTYGTCGITISTDATLNLPITPQSGLTRCTVDSQDVSVTTGASVGYTITLASTAAAVTMPGATNGGTINPVSGSYGTPALLTANTWGYRIDSTGSFGAGPTSTVSSGAVPSLDFAPLASSGSPQTIITTAEPAGPSVTTVWFGACADMSLPADTYSREVVYTAMTN